VGVAVRRPDPARWLWYAYGGGLPERFAPWVLHDTTCRTWVVRHVIRAVVQIAPIVIAIIVFVPGPIWLRVACALGGTIMGLIFSISYAHETAEHRLVRPATPRAPGPPRGRNAPRTRTRPPPSGTPRATATPRPPDFRAMAAREPPGYRGRAL
jgi:hypothetical protein